MAAAGRQLARLGESSEKQTGSRIEICYSESNLKLPEDVDLKAVVILLNPYAAMTDLSRVTYYYVACGHRDPRLVIDRLAGIVMTQYGLELQEDSLFLFCGRHTDRIKALYWAGDGYVLLYKRLSNGCFQWPWSESELHKLELQSFRLLTEGLRIEQPKAI